MANSSLGKMTIEFFVQADGRAGNGSYLLLGIDCNLFGRADNSDQ